MYNQLKDIDPDKLSGSDARSAIILLLGAVERLMSEIEGLKKENQLLRDENNRLKGGNSRPYVKGLVKRPINISSGGKEKGGSKEGGKGDIKHTSFVEIDETVKVEFDKSQLPVDAIFKGYTPYTQQDIEIKRNNRVFLFENWYSPAMGKTFSAPWPEGELAGHYGAGIRSLLSVLHHMSDVTESQLCNLMKSFGVKMSAGTISNLLKKEAVWALEEQENILRAGLKCALPKQMDTTANRQKGVNKMTHIITNALFAVFYTTDTRNRLDCLRVLQGNPQEGIKLLWYEGIEVALRAGKLGAGHPEKLKKLMEHTPCLTLTQFDTLMEKEAPELFKRTNVMRVMREEMALAYYKWQQDFLPIKVLLSDDAHEYNKITEHHGLCWVHDARRYNMLSPSINWHAKKLGAFKTRYWEYYRKLLHYTQQKEEDRQKLKTELLEEFDELFTTSTRYESLNKVMEGTLANKQNLLLALEFPDLPLHNNAAELAARRVVRKRDISLHTWSTWGTKLRDAFLSIIQTAYKLKVSPFQFICDRISQKNQMPSLATLILQD